MKEVVGELDPMFEGYFVTEVGQVRKDTEGGGYYVPLWYWRDIDAALKVSGSAVNSTRNLIPDELKSKALDPDTQYGPDMPQPCAIYEWYTLKHSDKPWLE